MSLCEFNVSRIQSPSPFLKFEGYLVAFTDLVDQTGCMYEVFFVGIRILDESKTFDLVEKFYCSSFHKNVC
jgi:hypothetical protein